MKVLSLFDGLSGGRIALDRAGIKVEKYVSSEIDKHAIKISKSNWGDIAYVGDVTKLDYNEGDFELLLAGSPCQGFSNAGIGEAFNDSRSSLYFEFLRLKNKIKPKYWLLENVKMKKEYEDIITDDVGVLPVLINSKLLSAQNRERMYWTNIPFILPKDKGIMLKDIIGEYDGIWVFPRGGNKGGIQHYNGKSPCITTSSWEYNFKIVKDDNIRQFTIEEMEQIQTLPIGYTNYVPKTKRTHAIGNGWTIDVIVQILKGIENE
jgi:site-specific DNA-cytosine methylase